MHDQTIEVRRTELLQKVRGMLDLAETQQRALTDDEEQTIDRMMAEAEALRRMAQKRSVLDSMESRSQESRPPVLMQQSVAGGHDGSDAARRAFEQYVRRGTALMPAEQRALLSGTGGGSYLVPVELYNQIIEQLGALVPMRSLATVIRTAAKTDIPVATGRPTAAYVNENTASTPSDPTTAQKNLRAKKIVTIVQVSEELLADSAFDVEQFLTRQMAVAFAEAEDAAFVAGNGTSQPAGVVQAVTAGPTASGVTALTYDNLIDLYYALPAQYAPRAVFLMKSSTMAYIAKLKDSQNRYLWTPPFGPGQPSTILGRPIYLDENVPAIGTTNRSVIFFDPSYYVIADRTDMEVQRLEELYIASGIKAFRAVRRNDGVLTVADAGRALVHP